MSLFSTLGGYTGQVFGGPAAAIAGFLGGRAYDNSNPNAAAEAGRNNLPGQMAMDQATQAAQNPPAFAAGGGSGLSSYQAVNQNYDPRALQQYQAEASRSGPSKWSVLAGQQQNNAAMNSKDQLAKDIYGQNASAQANLAMRGGLTGGARERVAREGNQNFMGMSQGVNQQRTQNLYDIAAKDEQNRVTMLGNVPGMQAQRAGLFGQANQYDTTAMNAYNADTYKSKMGYLGGRVQAASQPQEKTGLFGLW